MVKGVWSLSPSGQNPSGDGGGDLCEFGWAGLGEMPEKWQDGSGNPVHLCSMGIHSLYFLFVGVS